MIPLYQGRMGSSTSYKALLLREHISPYVSLLTEKASINDMKPAQCSSSDNDQPIRSRHRTYHHAQNTERKLLHLSTSGQEVLPTLLVDQSPPDHNNARQDNFAASAPDFGEMRVKASRIFDRNRNVTQASSCPTFWSIGQKFATCSK